MATQFADVSFNGLGAFSPSGIGIGYLRPDADDVDGGWTNELDGSVLFSSIDEAAPANDSDYIKSSENPGSDVCQVRLSNPSSLVTTPAKVRTRYKKSAASGTIYLTVRLKQGTTDIAEWSYSDISDTFTISEETLTDPQFNSITDFNDLFLEFEATTSPLAALIAGLTADGIFAKLDRLWIFAQATEALALVDLVASATATAVNSPTFTANRGYAGNGSTSYVDSNYNPSTQGTHFQLNSASLSIWSNTSRGPNSVVVATGAYDGTSIADLWLYGDSGGTTGVLLRLNRDTAGLTKLNSTSQGFFTTNRSTSTASQAYYNGASLGSDATVSTAVPNNTMFICARHDVGAGSQFSTDQICCAAIGGSLSSTDVLNFYNRLRTYMTAVGVP
jgi:hypothetical protein